MAICQKGQRGSKWPDREHGRFAWLLARGFSGEGDKNRDNQLENTELFVFLKQAMAATAAKTPQSPALFLPDDRPPRLTDEAKKAIRKLGAYLRQSKVDAAVAEQQYTAAKDLSGEE